jgi:hypothetical protein
MEARHAFLRLALLLAIFVGFAYLPVAVHADSLADLTVDSIWLEDASQPGQPVSQISPGQSFLIVATIKNIGQATAPGFYLDVYYDSDYGRGGPDNILAGEVQTWYVGPLTATNGTHTTKWVVDPDNQIAELSESNNERDLTFTIGSSPATTSVTSTLTSSTTESYSTTTTSTTTSYVITVLAKNADGSALGGVQVTFGSQNQATDPSGTVQFSVPAGTYSLGSQSSVSGGSGAQYVFAQWSDGDTSNTKSIAVSGSATYEARYKTQYQLTMQANPSGGGTTSPSGGTYWYDSGSSVAISAAANSGYALSSWSGSGSGSYKGSSNPSNVMMNGPITETANFGQYVTVTFQLNGLASDASGTVITIDGASYAFTQFPQTFSWAQGSTHTISAVSPVSCGAGCQYVELSWSDNGAQSHQITAPSGPTTITATYKKQYQLTISTSPSGAGSTSPAVGSYWYDSGQTVSIQASPASGYSFSSWTGSGSGSYSGAASAASVTMNGPIVETATLTKSSGAAISGVTFLPNPALQGSAMAFTITIQNLGKTSLSSLKVQVTVYGPDGRSAGSGTGSISKLAGGSKGTVGISYTVPASAPTGTWTFAVYLYQGTSLLDQRAGGTFTVNQAIIAGSIVSVSDSPDPVARGRTVGFTVTIKNTGNVAWSSTSVTVKIYGADGKLVATSVLAAGSIQPGAQKSSTVSWKVPSNAQRGVWRYEVYVNYGSVLIGSSTDPANTFKVT